MWLKSTAAIMMMMIDMKEDEKKDGLYVVDEYIHFSSVEEDTSIFFCVCVV